MTTAATLVLAALALPAAAAGVEPPPETDPTIADGTAQQALDDARATWQAAGVRHYRMRMRTDCFCGWDVRGPRRIEVRDGNPVARPPAHLRGYATIWRLFSRIQDAIDDEVAGLTVEYDRRGVPRNVYVDVSHTMIDEERGTRVVRFRALD
jgi:hypothetical protein